MAVMPLQLRRPRLRQSNPSTRTAVRTRPNLAWAQPCFGDAGGPDWVSGEGAKGVASGAEAALAKAASHQKGCSLRHREVAGDPPPPSSSDATARWSHSTIVVSDLDPVGTHKLSSDEDLPQSSLRRIHVRSLALGAVLLEEAAAALAVTKCLKFCGGVCDRILTSSTPSSVDRALDNTGVRVSSQDVEVVLKFSYSQPGVVVTSSIGQDPSTLATNTHPTRGTLWPTSLTRTPFIGCPLEEGSTYRNLDTSGLRSQIPIFLVVGLDMSKDCLDLIQNRTKERRYNFDNVFGSSCSNTWASPSEFVIPLDKYVKAVYHTRVSIGMRFRMLFKIEEYSVRRYMGTVTGISDLDPVRWPNSYWCSVKAYILKFSDFPLQQTYHVGWDESTSGERQPRVSLWEIEPLTTFPMYPSSFPLRLKRPWPSDLPSLHGGRDDLMWLRDGDRAIQSLNFQGFCNQTFTECYFKAGNMSG
ncbi:hypothetical protein ZIOFF_047449 [Zingiber officinale]|uniref:Auxin response factor domain-containing protein n=1 Tax=Zingiber officinale TaxID=94328 RepID=A0A8J5FXA9_ZINOF|nr:hypothetical protein ZIOFF_047449 [Zingiber officinale]